MQKAADVSPSPERSVCKLLVFRSEYSTASFLIHLFSRIDYNQCSETRMVFLVIAWREEEHVEKSFSVVKASEWGVIFLLGYDRKGSGKLVHPETTTT